MNIAALTSYYYYRGQGYSIFVSESGSGGDGTQANPWSPSEFETALGDGTIEENTTVKFKRGDTFEIGDIDVAVANLTFDAYGTGDDPVIIGSEDISGLTWTDGGSGLYSADMATAPEWIFIDGEAAKAAESGWIPITSKTSTTCNVNATTISNFGGSIIGAKAIFFESAWQTSKVYTVTDYSAGVITVDGTIGGSAFDILLFDQQKFLNENGEWWYDAVNDKLYVQAAASPSTLDIRVCTKQVGLDLQASGITVKNIAFKHYGKAAIFSDTADVDNTTISNCTITDIRSRGIWIGDNLLDNDNTTISNCTITRCGRDGVRIVGVDGLVEHNDISEIGMQASYPYVDDAVIFGNGNMGIGVFIRKQGGIVRYNTIDAVAYCGVHTGGNNMMVEYNVITDFMKRFRDGGAIYTIYNIVEEGSVPNSDVNDNLNNTFRNNIIYGCPATVEGNLTDDAAIGIYVDNKSTLMTVDSNVIQGPLTYGIYFNRNTTAHTVTDNIVWGADASVKWIEDVNGDGRSNLFPNQEQNILTGNILVATTTSQYCVEVGSWNNVMTVNPFENGGSSTNNQFVNPYAEDIAQYHPDVPRVYTGYTFTEWKTLLSQDADTEEKTNYLTSPGFPASNVKLIMNETNAEVNDAEANKYTDFDDVVVTNYTIPAYYGLVLYALPNSENSIQFASASSQSVNFGTTADIQFNYTVDIFTIQFWIRVASNPASEQTVLTNRGAGGKGYSVMINTSGQIALQLKNATQTHLTTGATDIADDQWHHIQIVKPANHNSVAIRVDTVAETLTKSGFVGSSIISTDDLILGAGFDGLIDELAIWPSGMGAEVSALYNSGMTFDMTEYTTPPLHYWKLGDDGYVDSGSSANKLDGTAVNNPTVSTDVP